MAYKRVGRKGVHVQLHNSRRRRHHRMRVEEHNMSYRTGTKLLKKLRSQYGR